MKLFQFPNEMNVLIMIMLRNINGFICRNEHLFHSNLILLNSFYEDKQAMSDKIIEAIYNGLIRMVWCLLDEKH